MQQEEWRSLYKEDIARAIRETVSEFGEESIKGAVIVQPFDIFNGQFSGLEVVATPIVD